VSTANSYDALKDAGVITCRGFCWACSLQQQGCQRLGSQNLHCLLLIYATNLCQSASRSVSQSVRQAVSQSARQSASQSVGQPACQPASQSVSQSASQSVSQSLSLCSFQLKLTNQSTPCSRVVPANTLISQLGTKFPGVIGTRESIAVFETARQFSPT
jgi:hypothetical protein